MKKIFIMLSLALSSLGLYAQDFTFEGVNYTVLNAKEKTVTTKVGSASTPGTAYVGSLVLPEHVSDGTDTYTLTQVGDFSFHCTQITSLRPRSPIFVKAGVAYL